MSKRATDCAVAGLRGRAIEREFALNDAPHDGGHLACGSFTEAEARLISWHGLSGWNVDFFVKISVFESCGADGCIDVGEAEAIDGEVGCGVVAEDDHQGECVTESEWKRRGEFAENA